MEKAKKSNVEKTVELLNKKFNLTINDVGYISLDNWQIDSGRRYRLVMQTKGTDGRAGGQSSLTEGMSLKDIALATSFLLRGIHFEQEMRDNIEFEMGTERRIHG